MYCFGLFLYVIFGLPYRVFICILFFVIWHLTFALHGDVYSQNTMKSVKSVSSSRAYLLVKDQLAKAKASVVQYQALYEKLQVLSISFLSFRVLKHIYCLFLFLQ